MQHQAQQAAGRRLSSRELGQFTALQRQVAQTLRANYLQDHQPALQRQQEYAGHVVTLQRHPISSLVSQAFMGSVPAGERPALQRAVDEAMQREAMQRQQDEQALQTHSLQRQLAELEQEATLPVFERIQSRRGAGNPLPEAVQRHLEQGLNHDLSSVRIHDDAEADKLAKGVNAVAFTTGRDIYFQSGRFNPNTQSGLELLAHEVTHTIQQSKGQVGKGVDPDSGLESEARQMGRKLSIMKTSAAKISAKQGVQRAPLTAGHAIQRQAKGGGGQKVTAALLKRLAQAINSGNIEDALKIIRNLNKAEQSKALMEMMRQFRGKMGAATAEGLQAMIDGLSSRIPEAIKKTVKKGTTIKQGPWTFKGKRELVPAYIGTNAHQAIAGYYRARHPGETIFTNYNPLSTIIKGKGLKNLTDEEQGLKPDIVNMNSRHLYEIKSRGSAALAVTEANMYLALFRKANIPMNLGPVDDPGTIGIVPAPGGHYSFQAIAPGAIVYDYRRGDYNPAPATAPAKAKAPATAPNVAPAMAPAPGGRQQQSQPQPAPANRGGIPLPTDPDFMDRMAEITGLTGVALIIYLIISEGSRVIPARNLIPVP